MKEYEGHASILIGDVNCDGDGKSLCDEVGIEGFPTLKYGDPTDLQDYEGDRQLDALSKFAKESLGPTCGPAQPELCDEAAKKKLDTYMTMSMSDLTQAVEEKNEEMSKAQKELEEFLESLQEQYDEAQKKLDDKKKEIKEAGLGMMKAVYAHRNSAKSEL
mmetsp:Transcript_64495/g.185373  ORF Transcript_64495/g.185373 Transcript_64495/m.185373 type:complete len:161 (-) Transcript_64495:73-555(-)